MVQKHSGEIAVYSEIGTGTVFRIYLPLSASKVELSNSKDETIIAGSGSILIADDEELIAITVSQMLERMGYTTFTVSNGQEALAFLSENHIDLVILDMIMPVMNGKDAFLEIKANYPDLPALLSSGFSKDEDVTIMKDAGLSGFIHKPYRRAELSKAVYNALH
jgi:CheY-like chemotaxis protein